MRERLAGNSIGTLTIGQNLQLVNNSTIEFELAATSGVPGFDWDFLDINGDLDLSQATGVTIELTSLDGSGNAGQLVSFDPNSSFSIAILAADNITGFSFADFFVDASGFANSFGGSFFLSVNDAATDSLLLNYTPLPLGDANGNGVLNNQDIASFVLALTNSVAYQAMFPDVDPDVVLDMNGDGVFNNLDIAGFVAALTGGGKK